MSDDDVQVRLRRTLEAIPAYVPGKPAQPEPGQTTYKLSSNENPYPPLPAVQAVVEQAAASMNRYPDMFATGLVQAIADHLGVPAEYVATGTGSVGVLGQIVAATCGEGDEVVFAWRSFEAYPIVAQAAGAVPGARPADRGRPARPARDGRRGDRPHPARAGLHPQQPDRARSCTPPSSWSSSTGCRATCSS